MSCLVVTVLVEDQAFGLHATTSTTHVLQTGSFFKGPRRVIYLSIYLRQILFKFLARPPTLFGLSHKLID
jgi:hypothetical protein